MRKNSQILFAASADWFGASRIPRYAHLAGASVSVLAPPNFRLSISSFVSERFSIAAANADETLNCLRRHLETGRHYEWIVFVDDILLDRAVERREEAWLSPLLPLRSNERDAARALISKCAFSRAMQACGVLMPKGQGARGSAEILAAAEAVGFPVLAKPDRGFAGNSIFGANDAVELAARAELAAPGEYIVEHKIEGRLGGTPVLFDRGKPSWWSPFYKVGVWPEPFGGSCRRLGAQPEGMEGILDRMGAALELHGLFGVDWILAEDGKLFVIELNGRPIPMLEGNRQVAKELPGALRDFLTGRRALRRPPPEPDAAVWHAMPQSFQLACSHRDWLQAAGLLTGLGGKTDIPWGDWGLLKKHALEVGESVLDVIRNRGSLC